MNFNTSKKKKNNTYNPTPQQIQIITSGGKRNHTKTTNPNKILPYNSTYPLISTSHFQISKVTYNSQENQQIIHAWKIFLKEKYST